METVYAFIHGASRDYASQMSDAHTTRDAASADAQTKRNFGSYTGRVRKVTREDYDAAVAKTRQGIRPTGF